MAKPVSPLILFDFETSKKQLFGKLHGLKNTNEYNEVRVNHDMTKIER